MSTNKHTKLEEEIDLLLLFKKIKQTLIQIVLVVFRLFKKIISSWKTISALILAGVILGLVSDSFLEKNISKEAKILLRINFDSGNYIYDAVSLIEQKIITEDTGFFTEEIGLDLTENIQKINIYPIVDLKDIMVKGEFNANEMRALFDNLEFENSYSMTDGFKSDYEYHVLEMKMLGGASLASIEKIIRYFNSNPLFIDLKDRNLQMISKRIYDNELTIKQIDKILESYSKDPDPISSSAQFYIDNKEVNPNDLIETKISLQIQNERLKEESLLSTETVIAINTKSLLVDSRNISNTKTLYYPFLFLMAYIIIIVLYSLYKYLEKLDLTEAKSK